MASALLLVTGTPSKVCMHENLWSERGKSSQTKQPSSNKSAPTVILWLVSWSENKQKRFKLWSQKQFNPGLLWNYRNNKNKTFGCCSFFIAAVEEPQESRLEPFESHVHVTALAAEEKPRHLHQRESSHIFLSDTEKRERKGVDMGRDAFICRLPWKWTVSITTEEHMLYIILSSEYKSSLERELWAGSFR